MDILGPNNPNDRFLFLSFSSYENCLSSAHMGYVRVSAGHCHGLEFYGCLEWNKTGFVHNLVRIWDVYRIVLSGCSYEVRFTTCSSVKEGMVDKYEIAHSRRRKNALWTGFGCWRTVLLLW